MGFGSSVFSSPLLQGLLSDFTAQKHCKQWLISQLLRLLLWSALVHFALFFRATDSLHMSSHNIFDAVSSKGAGLTMGSNRHHRGVGHLFLLVLPSWLSLLSDVPM